MQFETDEYYLYSPDSGLFVIGQSGVKDWKNDSGNFYSRWEHPAYVQLMVDDELSIDDPVGFRIKASSGRDRPNKTLGLYWRESYGQKRVDETFLFEEYPLDRFKRIKLDAGATIFRNMVVEAIARNQLAFEVAQMRPIHLFINDNYWGLYNMEETISPHHFDYKYGVDDDLVNILWWDSEAPLIDDGTSEYWNNEVLSRINNLDFNLDASVDELALYVDLQSLIDYFIFETYIFNWDWPVNNMKWWNAPDNSAYKKWKFILNDTDFACYPKNVEKLWLGSFYRNSDNVRLEYASGFIVFDALMQNERFRNRFFSRYLEVTFEPNRVQQIIEDYIAMLEGEYRLHYLKWGGMNFNEVVEDLRDIGEFNEKRAKWIRPLILQWYNETL
ncbi:MAG: CotH kinase family protein [Cyclobacteriaceae bacterium]